MNTTFWIMVVPFAVAGIAYIGSGLGYGLILNRPGMALAMFSYTVSCVGLVYDALTVVTK